jgi:hypothetical protein
MDSVSSVYNEALAGGKSLEEANKLAIQKFEELSNVTLDTSVK